MQEFYVASTAKLGADPLIVKDILRSFERFETVLISPGLIKEAIDCSIINRLSFWDALIVVSAESAQCVSLWSENLNPGQVIRGVRIENPLTFENNAFCPSCPVGPAFSRDQAADAMSLTTCHVPHVTCYSWERAPAAIYSSSAINRPYHHDFSPKKCP